MKRAASASPERRVQARPGDGEKGDGKGILPGEKGKGTGTDAGKGGKGELVVLILNDLPEEELQHWYTVLVRNFGIQTARSINPYMPIMLVPEDHVEPL